MRSGLQGTHDVRRTGRSDSIGQILADVAIGPSVLGWMAPYHFLTALAELGVMFLLFRVGLEMKNFGLD
jgi:Kef-type K+ transport system membrane component KefB